MEGTQEERIIINSEKEKWTSHKNIFFKTTIMLFVIFSMINSILIYNFIITMGKIIK